MSSDERFEVGFDNLYRPEEWPDGFFEAVRSILEIASRLGKTGLSFQQALVEAQNVIWHSQGDWAGDDVHALEITSENLERPVDVRVWGRGEALLAHATDSQLREILETVKTSVEPFQPPRHGTDHDMHSYLDYYHDSVLQKVLSLIESPPS